MSFDESTPFLVLINHDNNDITWVDKLLMPHVVLNGKLSANLLRFIADNYDVLPQHIVNVHDREHRFYHDGSLVDKLNDPNFGNTVSGEFWNFGTQKFGGVKAHLKNMKDSGWWAKCVSPYFGDIEQYGDFTYGKRSYWQFVVSKDRIKSLPKEFYTDMLDWVINNTLDEGEPEYDIVTGIKKLSPNWEDKCSDYNITKYLECSWELIFTVWKPVDVITLSDGREFHAVYGALGQYRDVTNIAIKKFYDVERNKFVISTGASFNDLFGDPICDHVKTLSLTIGETKVEITETRTIVV